jgi:hypothetical protein
MDLCSKYICLLPYLTLQHPSRGMPNKPCQSLSVTAISVIPCNRYEELRQLSRSTTIAQEADELIKSMTAVLQKMHSTAGRLQIDSFKQQDSLK